MAVCKIQTSPLGSNGFCCPIDHDRDLLVALVFPQVQPLETLQLVPRLHEFLLQPTQLLLLLAQCMSLIVDLSLQTLIFSLQVCTLLQDLIDAALDLIHTLIHQPHILLLAFRLLHHLPQGGGLLVMRTLHLLDNAHEDLVALPHTPLLLLDARLVEVVDVLQSLMQLHHSVHQHCRGRLPPATDLRMRLGTISWRLLPSWSSLVGQFRGRWGVGKLGDSFAVVGCAGVMLAVESIARGLFVRRMRLLYRRALLRWLLADHNSIHKDLSQSISIQIVALTIVSIPQLAINSPYLDCHNMMLSVPLNLFVPYSLQSQ